VAVGLVGSRALTSSFKKWARESSEQTSATIALSQPRKTGAQRIVRMLMSIITSRRSVRGICMWRGVVAMRVIWSTLVICNQAKGCWRIEGLRTNGGLRLAHLL
jgi:hypothetical protein